ncbi:MAG: hypothetical protein EXR35_04635 [Limnohabitans sp.]|nr:hypothetical protein [Limnohabitans sp.]
MQKNNVEKNNANQPLGLTVYDLPSPVDSVAYDAKRTRAGRFRMLLVFIICLSPVVASYFMYYVARPASINSFGELIQPTRSLPHSQMIDLQGQAGGLSQLKKQWLLISVGSGACPLECQNRLYLQRQILASLGKERGRVDWVWLISDDEAVPAQILPGLQEAQVWRIQSKVIEAWLKPQTGFALQDHFYLVDPMGEWMMRFSALIDKEKAALIKKDLERVLRASAGWDLPGR